jgi:hypothetical protein
MYSAEMPALSNAGIADRANPLTSMLDHTCPLSLVLVLVLVLVLDLILNLLSSSPGISLTFSVWTSFMVANVTKETPGRYVVGR